MIVNPGTCEPKILDIHGQTGREWLDRLADTLATCAERWSLQVLPPFTDLSYNYVTPAVTTAGEPVVIKAGVPSRELDREMEGLRAFDGHGITRLIDANAELGVMLLERLLPGEPLADVDDDETVTHVAVSVMRQLWTPAPAEHDFATVREWAADLDALRRYFDGGFGPFPPTGSRLHKVCLPSCLTQIARERSSTATRTRRISSARSGNRGWPSIPRA